jgi:hypothetical protein
MPRSPTLATLSTDQKVGGSSPSERATSERATLSAGQNTISVDTGGLPRRYGRILAASSIFWAALAWAKSSYGVIC